MAEWSDYLIRDSINDNGQIPSPGNGFSSPDIICTQQEMYSDPESYFCTKQEYSQDPNLEIKKGLYNYFYIRAKNLGEHVDKTDLRVQLFWCPSSLFLFPDQWKNNVMQSVNSKGDAQDSNTCQPVHTGNITVTDVPFAWRPEYPEDVKTTHFCLIAALSSATHPWSTKDIPAFSSWEDYVMWVRNNRNIAQRNVDIVHGLKDPQYSSINYLGWDRQNDTTIMIEISWVHLLVGTKIEIFSELLAPDSNPLVYQVHQASGAAQVGSFNCPAGYRGYVQTIASRPKSNWPTHADIKTILSGACNADHPAARYAHPLSLLPGQPEHENFLLQTKATGSSDKLLVLGACEVLISGED